MQAGGVREGPRRRNRLGGKGRRNRAVAVACASVIRFFVFAAFRLEKEKALSSVNRHVDGWKTNVDGSGRRLRGTCRAGSADVRGNGGVGGVSFPSLVARNLGAFRAKRAGERAGGDGKTGPFIAFGDVTHRQPWLARRS